MATTRAKKIETRPKGETLNIYSHHVVSLTLGPIEPCPGLDGYNRRLAWLDRNGELHDLVLFAETGPECLALIGERLEAYAAQARAPRSESPLTRGPLAETPQPRFKVGDKVTPISLENPRHFIEAGGVYEVDIVLDGDKDGKIALIGTASLWPASQFRLADPDPLACDP